MATAQYETRTETVEKTVVVLTLTEDEAEDLRSEISGAAGTGRLVSVHRALTRPVNPPPAADTFEYDGVTYELGVIYRDRTGDRFKFEAGTTGADGTPQGRFWDPDREAFGGLEWTLRGVVACWAPLTKVSA